MCEWGYEGVIYEEMYIHKIRCKYNLHRLLELVKHPKTLESSSKNIRGSLSLGSAVIMGLP